MEDDLHFWDIEDNLLVLKYKDAAPSEIFSKFGI
jgi:hypothetical protein